MRIGYLVNQYPKVSHTFVRREIQALEAKGVTVERFTVRDTSAEVKDDDDRAELKKTHVLLPTDRAQAAATLASATAQAAAAAPQRFRKAAALAVRFAQKADRRVVHAAYLGEAARLKVLAAEHRLDHVHAHFGTNSATVAALCHAMGGPTFSFTAHGPEEFDRPEILGLEDKIKLASFVVGVSSFGRSQLLRRTPADMWDKIKVVPCGVDDAFLSDRFLSPTTGAPRLVCVGRLCEQKGQILLIEAAARLKKTWGEGFELVLVGDGEMRGTIETLIHTHGLSAQVRITGWASGPEVRAELLAGRAMVLPSFAEGLPVVIMEALALERPVISTYVAGIPELVDDGCGFMVPAGSVSALEVAMAQALNADVPTLQRLGSEGRHRVIARHDARIAAELLEAAFAEAIQDRSR